MKRFLILSLVVMLSACVNLGDRGSQGEEEIAAQKAAQAEKERRRAAMSDEARERYDAMTDEERERYDAKTDEERERYDAMSDEARERYDAMTDEERERYDAKTDEEREHYDAMTDEEREHYDAMTDEEREHYDAMSDEAHERYDAMTDEERERYDAKTVEERERYDAMTDEERTRYDAMTDEERTRYDAMTEEEHHQEEIRRESELAQIEELRQLRLEDNDDPGLVGMVTEEQLRKANPLLLEQSIYYDYDQYSVNTKYATVIVAHARFLVANPTVKIFMEGNCDDRGSPEYNIALGQRRSDSIERTLLALGVPPGQIESVSFGAERPVAFGQNEDAWARNRRADFAYPMLKDPDVYIAPSIRALSNNE
jgi:peptidoglycan-associated lipoprotein